MVVQAVQTPPQYYQAFANQNQAYNSINQTYWKFQTQSLSALQAGDLMAIDYIDSDNGCSLDNSPEQTGSNTTANGHMTIVESISAPILTTLPGSEESVNQYDISVFDSNSSYHGKQDTRYIYPDSHAPFTADQGLGRGTMRFYTNMQNGQVVGYKWSQESNNTCRPDQRRVKFSRLIQF